MKPINMLNMKSMIEAMARMKPMTMEEHASEETSPHLPGERDNSKKARQHRCHRKVRARIAAASRRHNRNR